MRVVFSIISLLGALAVVSTAAATPTKTTQVSAVLVGNGCGVTGLECGRGGGGSCVCFAAFWNFVGGGDTSLRLGALASTGSYSDGYFCAAIAQDFSCLVPLAYTRSLTLTLGAPNGDRLALDESFASGTRPSLLSQDDNPVQGAWTVDQGRSSGRFARYTGSGTYTLSFESHDTYATFTIALAGSLTFQ